MEKFDDEKFCSVLKAYAEEFLHDRTQYKVVLPAHWKDNYKEAEHLITEFEGNGIMKIIAGSYNYTMEAP